VSDPNRDLPAIMQMPTHDEGLKDCATATSVAVHAVTLSNGHSYAAVVFNQPGFPIGYANVINRAEGEAIIELLRLALDDADRLNAGGKSMAMEFDPKATLN
jgi:hypothetical protein